MNRKVSYEDCLSFIENYLHIELLDFQKELLKHICNGEYIWGGRGCGRSTVIKGYTKYNAHLLENYYDVKPNITRSLPQLVKDEYQLVKDGYSAEFYHIDEEPIIDFKNGSWIKTKE